ncbi:MAG: hypothetical protein ACP5KN_19970, partial [Armatimonadota bacterium]
AQNRDGLAKPALHKGSTNLVRALEILEPDENPVTDNNFVFDAAADPNGACQVAATGTTHGVLPQADLEWELDTIQGSTLTSDPDPPKGQTITFTYTRLPSSNSEFGNKMLTLSHSQVPCEDTQTVQIFFSEEATNHPPPDTAFSPNWYYYWSQTTASWGSHVYDPQCGNPWGRCVWQGDHWQACISYGANEGQGNPLFDEEGIDWFAVICRHEGQHVMDFSNWWPNGYNQNADLDNDWVPDADELQMGYDPGLYDTFPDDPWPNDCEHHCETHRAQWAVGAADPEDWAHPGHQDQQ